MKKIISWLLVMIMMLSINITTFADDVKFTRGSFCVKIVELLEIEYDVTDISNPFSDVNTGDGYYNEILTMYMLGYMNDDEGCFNPTSEMTTGQVAMVITEMIFGDFTVPEDVALSNKWYAPYAWKAKESGLMPNVTDWEIYACENDIDAEKLKREYNVINETYSIATIKSISRTFNSDDLLTLQVSALIDGDMMTFDLAPILIINRKAYRGVDLSANDIVTLKAMIPLETEVKIKTNSKNEIEQMAYLGHDFAIKEPTETMQLDGVTYYVIDSCEELAFIACAGTEWLGRNYVQTADICLNDTIPIWDDSGVCINADELCNWTPIGNESQPFTGTFFGNGYSIERLYSSGETLSNRGLFGVIEGGNIDGLYIKDSYVSNANNSAFSMTGILAGTIKHKGTAQNVISNCYVERCCVLGYLAGGYAGSIGGYYLYLPIIENCYADISVYGLPGENGYVGGFFGTANCQAYNCFVTGKVSGYGMLGGFTGWNETMNTSFTNCLSTCEVSSKNSQNFLKTGGFIGDNTWATLVNCFWLQTDEINSGYNESEKYGYAVAQNGELSTSKELFSDDNAKNILNSWIQENNTEYAEWLNRLDVIFLSKPHATVIKNGTVDTTEQYNIAIIEDISSVLNVDGMVTLEVVAMVNGIQKTLYPAPTIVINGKEYSGVGLSNNDITTLKNIIPLDTYVKIAVNSSCEIEKIISFGYSNSEYKQCSVKSLSSVLNVDGLVTLEMEAMVDGSQMTLYFAPTLTIDGKEYASVDLSNDDITALKEAIPCDINCKIKINESCEVEEIESACVFATVSISNLENDTPVYTVIPELSGIEYGCEIIVVGYNDAKMVDGEFLLYADSEEELSVKLYGNIDKIKIMVWENLTNVRPICSAETLWFK